MAFRPGLVLTTAAFALALQGRTADAAEYHKLAFSERLGITVYSELFPSGTWCSEDVTLKISAKDKGFFGTKDFLTLLPKLGGVLKADCPQASSASITGTAGEPEAMVYRGEALAANGWAPKPVSEEAQEAPGDELAPPPPPQARPAQIDEAPAGKPVPAKPTLADIRRSAQEADYESLFYAYVDKNPGLLEQPVVIDQYAQMVSRREYKQLTGNEFKFGSFLKKAKSHLVSKVAGISGYFTMFVKGEIGKYDFAKGTFPFVPFEGEIRFDKPYTRNWIEGPVPETIAVAGRFEDLITELPMAKAKAERLVSRGSSARWVFFDTVFSVESASPPKTMKFGYSRRYASSLQIVPHEIRVYSDKKKADLIKVYNGQELETLAVAAQARDEQRRREAEREAAEQKRREAELLERQSIEAARQQASADFKRLKIAGHGARVAYLHDGSEQLTNLGYAVADFLARQSPIPVRLLVRTDEWDDKDLTVSWPQGVRLQVAPDTAGLKEDAWFVISGEIVATAALDEDATALPDAVVKVRAVTACREDDCRETEDVAALVRVRNPDAKWEPADE